MVRRYYLLTAFGKDRPGIVAAVSRVLLDLQGNIEDASMTRLGGEFSMMLVTALTVPAPSLEKRLNILAKKEGLQISAKPIPSAAVRRSKDGSARYLISLYGNDRPGLVCRVAEALSRRRVSITDLQTQVIGTAAKPVYVMLLEIMVPPALDLEALRTELDNLRRELNVEITLQDIEAVPL